LFTLPVDLNPEWDQIIYTPVHSLKETLLLEVMDYQNLTKDRSLGTVELKVGELARVIERGADDHPLYFFESTGKKDKSEPIRLDPGNQYKGQLHYLAEFLPAFALQGLKFETDSNGSQSAVAGVDGEGDDVEGNTEPVMVRRPTTKEPIGTSKEETKNQQSAEASTSANEVPKATGDGELSPTRETHKRQEKEGIKMSTDELLTHRTW
jgi:C2 domain